MTTDENARPANIKVDVVSPPSSEPVERPDDKPSFRQPMQPWTQTVLVALITSLVTQALGSWAAYPFWRTQQTKLQAWSSRPVVDIRIVTAPEKVLSIRNVGRIGIEDVRLFATIYKLATAHTDNGTHQTLAGIESYSKLPGPLRTYGSLKEDGGEVRVNLLKDFGDMLPMRKLTEGFEWKYYAFRITFRSSVTKQRYIAYLFTTPFSDFNANIFDDPETLSIGGGYQSSKHLREIRDLLKRDQTELFDDPGSEEYVQ